MDVHANFVMRIIRGTPGTGMRYRECSEQHESNHEKEVSKSYDVSANVQPNLSC